MDLRIDNKCNESEDNYAEIGKNYELPPRIEEDTDEAHSYVAGILEFKVDEIEVFEV